MTAPTRKGRDVFSERSASMVSKSLAGVVTVMTVITLVSGVQP